MAFEVEKTFQPSFYCIAHTNSGAPGRFHTPVGSTCLKDKVALEYRRSVRFHPSVPSDALQGCQQSKPGIVLIEILLCWSFSSSNCFI